MTRRGHITLKIGSLWSLNLNSNGRHADKHFLEDLLNVKYYGSSVHFVPASLNFPYQWMRKYHDLWIYWMATIIVAEQRCRPPSICKYLYYKKCYRKKNINYYVIASSNDNIQIDWYLHLLQFCHRMHNWWKSDHVCHMVTDRGRLLTSWHPNIKPTRSGLEFHLFPIIPANQTWDHLFFAFHPHPISNC